MLMMGGDTARSVVFAVSDLWASMYVYATTEDGEHVSKRHFSVVQFVIDGL